MHRICLLVLLCVSVTSADQLESRQLGLFESQGDVGTTPLKGAAEFNAATSEYRITGGGENIWGTADAFHFLWKRMSGDVTITADVAFVGKGAVGHRKAVLIVRQSLDADSAYVDIALHGDGLTSLQFRETPGAETREVRSEVRAPTRLRLERRGNRFTMSVGQPGPDLATAPPVTVNLQGSVYVGLGMCSHDAGILETAIFSNVSVVQPAPRPVTRSRISVYTLAARSTTVVYEANQLIEAPNWSPDGRYLLVNSGGTLWRLPLDGGKRELEPIRLSTLVNANNDHGISPDGRFLAISGTVAGGRGSQIFVSKIDGTNARLMTPRSPGYYHGYSPDGRWLAYTAQRDGEFDLFRVSVAGGEEQRLNKHPGLDDGPDYSPDGKWIYFNSERTGQHQIWRIPADGAGPSDERAERVLASEFEDWFPHPSPDGKWMVFLSYPKGTQGHPANRDVQLQLMPMAGARADGAPVESIVKLFGGQGTINVNSWSPDSQRFAFVSYELVPPDATSRR